MVDCEKLHQDIDQLEQKISDLEAYMKTVKLTAENSDSKNYDIYSPLLSFDEDIDEVLQNHLNAFSEKFGGYFSSDAEIKSCEKLYESQNRWIEVSGSGNNAILYDIYSIQIMHRNEDGTFGAPEDISELKDKEIKTVLPLGGDSFIVEVEEKTAPSKTLHLRMVINPDGSHKIADEEEIPMKTLMNYKSVNGKYFVDTTQDGHILILEEKGPSWDVHDLLMDDFEALRGDNIMFNPKTGQISLIAASYTGEIGLLPLFQDEDGSFASPDVKHFIDLHIPKSDDLLLSNIISHVNCVLMPKSERVISITTPYDTTFYYVDEHSNTRELGSTTLKRKANPKTSLIPLSSHQVAYVETGDDYVDIVECAPGDFNDRFSIGAADLGKVRRVKKLTNNECILESDGYLRLMTVGHHLDLGTLRRHLGEIPTLVGAPPNEEKANDDIMNDIESMEAGFR